MKGLLTNLPVFVLAFALVTFGMFYMNGMYKNIWKGDFTPIGIKTVVKVPVVTTVKKREVKEFLLQKLRPELKRHFEKYVPQKVVDTVYQNIVIDEALLDSFQVLNEKIAQLNIDLLKGIKEVKKIQSKKRKTVPVKKNGKERNAQYKSTAKLLEAMKPSKAAKVISYYSDNKAKEIIMLMNKKKAAKLMEIMDSQKVAKIMGNS